jgi:hypothetical protein
MAATTAAGRRYERRGRHRVELGGRRVNEDRPALGGRHSCPAGIKYRRSPGRADATCSAER